MSSRSSVIIYLSRSSSSSSSGINASNPRTFLQSHELVATPLTDPFPRARRRPLRRQRRRPHHHQIQSTKAHLAANSTSRGRQRAAVPLRGHPPRRPSPPRSSPDPSPLPLLRHLWLYPSTGATMADGIRQIEPGSIAGANILARCGALLIAKLPPRRPMGLLLRPASPPLLLAALPLLCSG